MGERNASHSRRLRWLRWLREPLLHFFVLGLVVLGLRGVLEERPEPADD